MNINHNNTNKNNPLDEKLTIKDLDMYASVSSKSNFLNMKYQMKRMIDFKNKLKLYFGFFTPAVFLPLFMITLALPAPHSVFMTACMFFLSIPLLPLLNLHVNKKLVNFVENKESYKNFQKDIVEMITHPNNSAHVFNTLSKLANNIDNLKEKEAYLHNLHDFLNHIIDKKLTLSDIEFFLNQDSILKELTFEKNEEHKINSFLQQLKQSNQAIQIGSEKEKNSTSTDTLINPILLNGKINPQYINRLETQQEVKELKVDDNNDIHIKLKQVKEKFSQHI